MQQSIETFVEKWQARHNDYFTKHYPNNSFPELTVTYGKKYAKVIDRTSVSAFIDLETGDILMAASWQKPAKHARGNVNSEQNGIEALDAQNFIKYLR